MSQSPELERALATMREAEALVASVRLQDEEDEAALRKAGLDPAVLREPDPARLSAADRHKLEEAVRQDRDEAEAAARHAGARVADPAPAKPKRSHDLI